MSSVLCDYLKRQMVMMTEAIEDALDSDLPGELRQQVIKEYLAKWQAFVEVRNFIYANYMEVDNEKNTNRLEH